MCVRENVSQCGLFLPSLPHRGSIPAHRPPRSREANTKKINIKQNKHSHFSGRSFAEKRVWASHVLGEHTARESECRRESAKFRARTLRCECEFRPALLWACDKKHAETKKKNVVARVSLSSVSECVWFLFCALLNIEIYCCRRSCAYKYIYIISASPPHCRVIIFICAPSSVYYSIYLLFFILVSKYRLAVATGCHSLMFLLLHFSIRGWLNSVRRQFYTADFVEFEAYKFHDKSAHRHTHAESRCTMTSTFEAFLTLTHTRLWRTIVHAPFLLHKCCWACRLVDMRRTRVSSCVGICSR